MCCGVRNLAVTCRTAMHLSEKLVSCIAVTSVITCFVFTTICMIALGIGIGFNYCIGENQNLYREDPVLAREAADNLNEVKREAGNYTDDMLASRRSNSSELLLPNQPIKDSFVRPTDVVPYIHPALSGLFPKPTPVADNVVFDVSQNMFSEEPSVNTILVYDGYTMRLTADTVDPEPVNNM